MQTWCWPLRRQTAWPRSCFWRGISVPAVRLSNHVPGPRPCGGDCPNEVRSALPALMMLLKTDGSLPGRRHAPRASGDGLFIFRSGTRGASWNGFMPLAAHTLAMAGR